MFISRRHLWWDVAVTGTAAACGVIVAAQAGPERVGGLLALCGILAAWFACGRWALRPASPRDRTWADPRLRGAAFVAIAVLLLAVLCRADPSSAAMLAVFCPYAWNWSWRRRDIVTANVLFAAAAAVGTAWGLGWTGDGWMRGGISAAASLLFSLVMGVWIGRIASAARREGQLQAELAAAHDELAELHRRAGAAAERERLARELHDTLTQTLTGIVMLAERTGEQLADDDSPASDGPAGTVGLLERTARQALAETRAIIAEGSAPGVGSEGLPARLDRITRSFATETGVTARFSASPPAPVLDRPTEVVLLRAAQEALANIRKHAGAGAVRVELRQDAHDTALVVADDGRGFPETVDAAQRRGSGLRGIRSRLALSDGQLHVTTGTTGTELRVCLPRADRAGDGSDS